MIEPEDQIPFDDLEGADKDDQQSQQDIHSNGLDEERIPSADVGDANTDLLKQSYDAAESSFTLNLGEDESSPDKTP